MEKKLIIQDMNRPLPNGQRPAWVKAEGQDFPDMVIYNRTDYFSFYIQMFQIVLSKENPDEAVATLKRMGWWNIGGFSGLNIPLCCGMMPNNRQLWFSKIEPERWEIGKERLAIINFFTQIKF